jgi:hypothetical protein
VPEASLERRGFSVHEPVIGPARGEVS